MGSMPSQRAEKVAAAMRELLAEMLLRGLKDPRLATSGLVTLSFVRLSDDLQHARVGLLVSGSDQHEQRRVLEGLASARGYLRGELCRGLRMRRAPELRFEIDRGFERGQRIDALLREVGAASEQGGECTGRGESGETGTARDSGRWPTGEPADEAASGAGMETTSGAGMETTSGVGREASNEAITEPRAEASDQVTPRRRG
jgi:ribosome-binding factor A